VVRFSETASLDVASTLMLEAETISEKLSQTPFSHS
jgi:hypothetical protein